MTHNGLDGNYAELCIQLTLATSVKQGTSPVGCVDEVWLLRNKRSRHDCACRLTIYYACPCAARPDCMGSTPLLKVWQRQAVGLYGLERYPSTC